MHGPAFARTQRRTIGGGARSRALENRLSWHRTSWRRTHGSSRGRSRSACRRGWPQGRLIHRTRPGLRDDHSRRRRCRRRWCARGGWSGSHGWWRCRRRWGPSRRRHHGRWTAGRNWRRRRCNGRSRSGRSRGGSRLRRSWRWSSKAWPRCRSRHYKLRRSGRRRSRRLRGGNRRRRRGRNRRLDGRRCNCRRSLRRRRRLLLADDGF